MDSEELSAVWRDPMEYNMQKHGPSYLPVTASQRVSARKFAQRRAANYDVPGPDKYAPMTFLLAVLQAAYLVHQTAHWQTRGGNYYSDHLLFQRIYEESQTFIDGVAERSIGLSSNPSEVALRPRIQAMHSTIQMLYPPETAPDVETLVRIGLDTESLVLMVIDQTIEVIKASGGWTPGLDDLLPAVAGKHEEFVYLLGQRSQNQGAGRRFASYDRR